MRIPGYLRSAHHKLQTRRKIDRDFADTEVQSNFILNTYSQLIHVYLHQFHNRNLLTVLFQTCGKARIIPSRNEKVTMTDISARREKKKQYFPWAISYRWEKVWKENVYEILANLAQQSCYHNEKKACFSGTSFHFSYYKWLMKPLQEFGIDSINHLSKCGSRE